VDNLEAWKRLDAERMVMSMQQPYMFCYGTIISANQSKESGDSPTADIGLFTSLAVCFYELIILLDSVIAAANVQLDRLKTSMVRLVGQSKASELQSQWQVEVEYQMTIGDNDSPTASNQRQENTLSSINQDSPKVNTENRMQRRDEAILSTLSSMMGLDNARLVHEICVDPSYKLPPSAIDPYSLPWTWTLSRTNCPVYFTDHAISVKNLYGANNETSISISIPASDSSVVLGSFQEMPLDSPLAGRIPNETISPTNSETYIDPDENSRNSASVVVNTEKKLKRVFLDILGDQLVCSLLQSPVRELNHQVHHYAVLSYFCNFVCRYQ
jgi:hypothetical protein